MITGEQLKFYTVKDVPAGEFIRKYAEYLKKNDKIELPKWLDFVKTGKTRELAPIDSDWLYVRTAALARKIYLRPHTGVGLLKEFYGGRHLYGVSRSQHDSGSGKIIRYCLQQLEKIGVLKKDKKHELKKGSRTISKEGQIDLNRLATQIVLEKVHKK